MKNSSSKRLGFFGTPEFAAVVLKAMVEANILPTIIFSQPPRPRGRGMVMQPSAVSALAQSYNLPVITATDWRDSQGEARKEFEASRLDLAIVVAYGKIIPAEVLTIPRLGFVNLHASLLPRWRGAAPIQRAILAGDSMTGVGLMQMAAELDTGDILAEKSIPILNSTTGGELHDQLASLSAELLLDHLPKLFDQSLKSRPQSPTGVTYAEKITKDSAKIDWHCSAVEIVRQVRAFAPHPSAWSEINSERIKILSAEASGETKPADQPVGTILNREAEVATGMGRLKILTLQRAGKNPTAASEWIQTAQLLGKRFSGRELPQ